MHGDAETFQGNTEEKETAILFTYTSTRIVDGFLNL